MMLLDHSEIISMGIIEKYFRQELTYEQETAFEEHLLYCKSCRDELHNREIIRSGIEETIYRDTFNKKGLDNRTISLKRFSGLNLPGRFITVAASVILLFGLGSIIWYKSIKSRESTAIAGEQKYNLPSSEKPDSARLDIVKDNKPVNKKPDQAESDLLAASLASEHFTPDPFYENIVKSYVRSVPLLLLEPKDSIAVKTNQEILFRWKSGTDQEYGLIILTNKGKNLVELYGTSIIHFKGFEKEGLYYWKLDSKQETLAAGKIVVY